MILNRLSDPLSQGAVEFVCGTKERFSDFHAAKSILESAGSDSALHGVPEIYSAYICKLDGCLHKVTAMQLLGKDLHEALAHLPRHYGKEQIKTFGVQIIDIMGQSTICVFCLDVCCSSSPDVTNHVLSTQSPCTSAASSSGDIRGTPWSAPFV